MKAREKVVFVRLSDEDMVMLDDLVDRERRRDPDATDVTKSETVRRLIRRAHDFREFALKRGKHASK